MKTEETTVALTEADTPMKLVGFGRNKRLRIGLGKTESGKQRWIELEPERVERFLGHLSRALSDIRANPKTADGQERRVILSLDCEHNCITVKTTE
jgi:hypothetical protein